MTGKRRLKCISILTVCFSILFSCTFGSGWLKAFALTEYETYLQNQGFPQSYWSGLSALHNTYPNWVFKAQKIPLKWNDVVNAESAVGRNLVAKSAVDSWKSFEYGAYNFDTKDWVGLDGSSWVAASKEIITYYLDPRSFLNDSAIYIFLNQSYDSSSQNLDGIKKVVNGSFLDASFPEQGYSTYSDVILYAASQSGVNPYVLASSILIEQGTSGSSGSISGADPDYPGCYNYFNVGAYATSSMTAVKRGLWYAAGSGSGSTTYNRPWNSRAKSIIGGSIFYGSSYISIGQNTLYYKKFNVVYPGGSGYYYHQYMSNIQGAEAEAKKLKSAYASLTDGSLVFTIPVYDSMPETPSVKPSSTGNNNNLLTALSVNGYNLTPTFTMYTSDYDLIVDKNTYSLTINATLSDSGASITTPLTVNLSDGDNNVPVTVKAPSGITRTYHLNVYKQQNISPPSVTSTIFIIDTYITNISPDTSIKGFIDKLSIANCTVKIVTSTGSAKSSGTVATGDKLQIIQNNAVYKTYEVAVNGDVNGDGTITPLDLFKIQKHILGVSQLSGKELSSADINRDGKITTVDCLKGQKYILKL